MKTKINSFSWLFHDFFIQVGFIVSDFSIFMVQNFLSVLWFFPHPPIWYKINVNKPDLSSIRSKASYWPAGKLSGAGGAGEKRVTSPSWAPAENLLTVIWKWALFANSFEYERLSTKTRFKKEAQHNLKMAYFFVSKTYVTFQQASLCPFWKLGQFKGMDCGNAIRRINPSTCSNSGLKKGVVIG